jgi:hypothetical protein
MNEHDVEDLLPHMRHVLSAERELQEQTLAWSLIEASSAIVGVGPPNPPLPVPPTRATLAPCRCSNGSPRSRR